MVSCSTIFTASLILAGTVPTEEYYDSTLTIETLPQSSYSSSYRQKVIDQANIGPVEPSSRVPRSVLDPDVKLGGGRSSACDRPILQSMGRQNDISTKKDDPPAVQ